MWWTKNRASNTVKRYCPCDAVPQRLCLRSCRQHGMHHMPQLRCEYVVHRLRGLRAKDAPKGRAGDCMIIDRAEQLNHGRAQLPMWSDELCGTAARSSFPMVQDDRNRSTHDRSVPCPDNCDFGTKPGHNDGRWRNLQRLSFGLPRFRLPPVQSFFGHAIEVFR